MFCLFFSLALFEYFFRASQGLHKMLGSSYLPSTPDYVRTLARIARPDREFHLERDGPRLKEELRAFTDAALKTVNRLSERWAREGKGHPREQNAIEITWKTNGKYKICIN